MEVLAQWRFLNEAFMHKRKSFSRFLLGLKVKWIYPKGEHIKEPK